jgi:uncharacterized protein YdeI (YjbR/CyaY-like superfamily)
MNPKVDFYFDKAGVWQQETGALREIVLDCNLDETLKWGCPCYTHEGANIVLIHVFKEYCALLFFKGALLSDPENILIRQTENVQAARQLRFTDLSRIKRQSKVIKAYIHEAVDVEKAGLKVEMKKTVEYGIPEEFRQLLDADATLKTAFEALTPGRQRAYLMFFTAAKQSKTRAARIGKSIPMILEGKGLND